MEKKKSEELADGELIRAYLTGDAESFEIQYGVCGAEKEIRKGGL